MIDPTEETLISLTEAARRLPRRRGGKKPHVSCVYRWTTRGCKGVILESIQVGGTRCTSTAALARFFRRLTDGDVPQPEPAPERSRRAAAAEHELEREGI